MKKELGQTIYTFMGNRDVSSTFSDPAHNSEYDFKDIEAVIKEKERIIAEIALLKSGNKVIKEAVYKDVESKEGITEKVLVTEEEKFIPQNDLDILSQLSSELLDCEQVLIDSK